jgi:peptidoglycan/xylan/chitin deacetylase (PgdA/CDA1 family)
VADRTDGRGWTRAAIAWVAGGVAAALVVLGTVVGVVTTSSGPDVAERAVVTSAPSTAPVTSVPLIITTTTTPAPAPPAAPAPATTAAPPVTVPIPAGTVAVIGRVTTTDPVVFFTIDDGATRDPAVIDFLRGRGIPVTLFPVLGTVRQDPSYFSAIHALGASVQDHTANHPSLKGLPFATQRNEICAPLDEFAARFGQRPWLFRPPGGGYDATTLAAAQACGMRAIVTWRATMNDGVLRTQGGPLRPGDIVLMHFRPDLRMNLEVALGAAAAIGLHPAALEAYLPPA